MKKIRLIVELEVDESAVIGPEIIKRAWGEKPRTQEWMDGIKHEQALLDALLANPKQYRDNLVAAVLSEIETTMYQRLYDMAGVPAGIGTTFRSLIPLLPEESAAFFRDMDEKDVLSENTELVNSAITVEIKKIDIEGI